MLLSCALDVPAGRFPDKCRAMMARYLLGPSPMAEFERLLCGGTEWH
jgi:hypothetical protein